MPEKCDLYKDTIRQPLSPEPQIQQLDTQVKRASERAPYKRFDNMWSSDLFPEVEASIQRTNLRKSVPHQQAEANQIIRMDYGLKYKEDNITDKI